MNDVSDRARIVRQERERILAVVRQRIEEAPARYDDSDEALDGAVFELQAIEKVVMPRES